MINTTRLTFNDNYNLSIPMSEDYIKLKKNECKTLLLYFGLPNSRITSINNDNIFNSTSDEDSEIESNNTPSAIM